MRIASRLMRRMADETYRQKLLDECQVLKPDLFLAIKGVGITSDLIQRIKKTGARAAMYYPDLHFEHPGILQDSFGEYDLFITTKTFQLDYLEALLGKDRVAFVSHGYSGSVHRPVFRTVAEDDYQVDLLYPGNHSAYKQKWLEDTVAISPGPSVEIIGNRWQESASKGLLSACRMPGARVGVAYAEAIQAARINIAVHFGPAGSDWEDLVSTRTFEIPACKGFMLHIDNDEVRDYFRPGEEIDVFSTPEELADKIKFYLTRPNLRATMIERAYQRCVPAYSYAERAKQIEDFVKVRLEY